MAYGIDESGQTDFGLINVTQTASTYVPFKIPDEIKNNIGKNKTKGGSFRDLDDERRGFIPYGDTGGWGIFDAGAAAFGDAQLTQAFLEPEKWYTGPGGAAQKGLFEVLAPPVLEEDQGYYGYGGGGGGGFAYEKPSTFAWIVGDYEGGENAPDWWRPFNVNNPDVYNRPDVAFTLMANALIGSGALSPEDARSLGKQLYGQWGGQKGDNLWDVYSDKFSDQTTVDGAPRLPKQPFVPISEEQAAVGETGPGIIDSDYFKSADRARQAFEALNNMREATVGGNIHEFGPGYQWLQNLAGAIEGTAGDDNFLTKSEELELRGQLDPLLAQSRSPNSPLGAFGALGRMLTQPFFTNDPPRFSQTFEGDYISGRRNPRLSF